MHPTRDPRSTWLLVMVAVATLATAAMSHAADPPETPAVSEDPTPNPGRVLVDEPPGTTAGDPASVVLRARALTRRGETGTALDLVIPLIDDPAVADEARLVALRAMELRGDLDRARELALETAPGADPRLVAKAAGLIARLIGEDVARELLTAALEVDRSAPGDVEAPLHVALGDLASGRGLHSEARDHYARVGVPAKEASKPAAADSVSVAAGADSTTAAPATERVSIRKLTLEQVLAADARVAAGRAAWGRGEFQTAKDLFEQASAIDPGHDEARLALAALLIEKHESNLGRAALRAVFTAYPQHPEALFLLARSHLADGRYRAAEDACERALEVNQLHPGILELSAVLDLADEEFESAAALIDRALLTTPESRSLRSLRAAYLLLIGNQEAADREVAAILAEAPSYANVHFVIGGCLDRLRRYPEAIAAYERALELDPEHAPAANAAGLAAMRDGQEELARRWLDRGFELDPYNIRAYNMRLLLDKLSAYHRVETAHFVIKLDDPDRPLAPLMAQYLESVYSELCPRFGFEPERKTTVEVFSERQLISARLIGLPGIEGIPGACFGSVIAMDSPRLWNGTVNWQTVVRHEFGHVLALEKTAKRVPFWFTEGLSVVLEDHPPLIKDDRLARSALVEGELIPFTALNRGFTRAKSRPQRSLAYYQSAFAIRRLISEHGFETILDLLDDYATGLSNAEAIAHRLGMSEAAWADDVDRAIRAHVEALPLWAFGSRQRLAERVKEASERPDDLAARTRMAEEWLASGELETAVSEALSILDADSTNVDARLVLGHALLLQGEHYAAAAQLEPLLDREEVDYLVVRDLGLVYAELGYVDAAFPYLEEAIRIYPADPEPMKMLAELYRDAGRLDEAAGMLIAATEVEEKPFAELMALADLAAEHGMPDVEAEALERSLAVRPFELETVSRLAGLYREEGDAAQAVRTYEVLCLLDPGDIQAHTTLVEMALEHGPQETARRYAERLRELDPESELARRALERL